MHPLKVSAQFAAYTWFLKQVADKPNAPQDAGRFARQN